jgi:hypothetical protein
VEAKPYTDPFPGTAQKVQDSARFAALPPGQGQVRVLALHEVPASQEPAPEQETWHVVPLQLTGRAHE